MLYYLYAWWTEPCCSPVFDVVAMMLAFYMVVTMVLNAILLISMVNSAML